MDRWSTTDWIDPLNLFDWLHCRSSRLNVLSRCIRSDKSIDQIGWIDFSHQIDQVNSLDQIDGVDLFNQMHRLSRSGEQNFQRLIYLIHIWLLIRYQLYIYVPVHHVKYKDRPIVFKRWDSKRCAKIFSKDKVEAGWHSWSPQPLRRRDKLLRAQRVDCCFPSIFCFRACSTLSTPSTVVTTVQRTFPSF